FRGEMTRAEEVIIVLVVDELLAVEKDEVDADRRFEALHMVGQLHEQRHARAAVVGADERLTPLALVGLLIGDRPRVVVRAEDDATLPLRVPADNEIGHRPGLALAALSGGELLPLDLAAKAGEVLFE